MGFKMRQAERRRSRLRMTIAGISKSGKTYSALRFAPALVGSTDLEILRKSIVVIASESGMVDKYIGDHPDGFPWAFQVCDLDNFSPSDYREAVLACGKAGFKVIIIDSLSHAWEGSGGALELVDKSSGANKFTSGWSKVTPMHRAMLEAIQRSPAHIIATMRTKADYVLEEDAQGKKVPKKVGTKEVQREDVDYEFDICCRIDNLHVLTIDGGRCPSVDGVQAVKPSMAFMDPIVHWLNDGVDVDDSYYTASEEDLAKVAAARETAAKVAEKEAKKNAPKETDEQRTARLEKQRDESAKKQSEIETARQANAEAQAKLAATKAEGDRLLAGTTGDHAEARDVAAKVQAAKTTAAAAETNGHATHQQAIEIVEHCKTLFGQAVKERLKDRKSVV